MIYLLHGEDDLSRREAVKALLPAPGSDEYLELSVFEGAADVQQIIQACSQPGRSRLIPLLMATFSSALTKLRMPVGQGSRRG